MKPKPDGFSRTDGDDAGRLQEDVAASLDLAAHVAHDLTLVQTRRTHAHEAGPLALGLGIAHDTHRHDHDAASGSEARARLFHGKIIQETGGAEEGRRRS